MTAFARIAHRLAVHLMRHRTEDYRTHRVEREQLAVLPHGAPTVTGSGDSIELLRGTHWVAAPADTAVPGPDRARRALVPPLVPRPDRRPSPRELGGDGPDWLRDLLDVGTG
ncbi:hypothetical protein [Streptomyces sp. NPDC096311]|uniref:hypothetical protein n=1 Tax=Streptomyces sp. NPDC096311 TaxID=3366083 RepID=UPI0037F86058